MQHIEENPEAPDASAPSISPAAVAERDLLDNLDCELDLEAIDLNDHLDDFVNEGLYDNSDTESSIGRMIEDEISLTGASLQEIDLDKDLLLGEDVYETIHYYSKNRDSITISPVEFDADSCSTDSAESLACSVDKESKLIEQSDSSRSDIGYSSNLNTTNNDESITEFSETNKKESFCSYNSRRVSKEEPIGRSVSDSFLNRIKGFRFLRLKKSKNKGKNVKSTHCNSAASSQSKFNDSGVLNYGSLDCGQLADLEQDAHNHKSVESLTQEFNVHKKYDRFNPCCVG